MSIYWNLLRNSEIAGLPDPNWQELQSGSPIPASIEGQLPEILPGGMSQLRGIRIQYYWANDVGGTRNLLADLGSVDITPVEIATLDGPAGGDSYGYGQTEEGVTRDDIRLIPDQRTGRFALRLTNAVAPAGATYIRVYWAPY